MHSQGSSLRRCYLSGSIPSGNYVSYKTQNGSRFEKSGVLKGYLPIFKWLKKLINSHNFCMKCYLQIYKYNEESIHLRKS